MATWMGRLEEWNVATCLGRLGDCNVATRLGRLRDWNVAIWLWPGHRSCIPHVLDTSTQEPSFLVRSITGREWEEQNCSLCSLITAPWRPWVPSLLPVSFISSDQLKVKAVIVSSRATQTPHSQKIVPAELSELSCRMRAPKSHWLHPPACMQAACCSAVVWAH